MSDHRPWCPAIEGGACRCRDMRDERTLDLFDGVEQPGLAEALALVEEAAAREPQEEP